MNHSVTLGGNPNPFGKNSRYADNPFGSWKRNKRNTGVIQLSFCRKAMLFWMHTFGSDSCPPHSCVCDKVVLSMEDNTFYLYRRLFLALVELEFLTFVYPWKARATQNTYVVSTIMRWEQLVLFLPFFLSSGLNVAVRKNEMGYCELFSRTPATLRFFRTSIITHGGSSPSGAMSWDGQSELFSFVLGFP